MSNSAKDYEAAMAEVQRQQQRRNEEKSHYQKEIQKLQEQVAFLSQQDPIVAGHGAGGDEVNVAQALLQLRETLRVQSQVMTRICDENRTSRES